MNTTPSFFRVRRASATLAALLLLLLCSTTAGAQQRTTFDALGNSDQWQNININNGNGFTSYSTNTQSLKATIKSELASQKDAGFKKVDKATFMATVQNPLEASFEVKEGYTYRVVAIYGASTNTVVVMLRDASRTELAPQATRYAGGRGGSYTPDFVVRLDDYTPKADGTAILGIGLMMDKQNDPVAMQLLIFRKKK